MDSVGLNIPLADRGVVLEPPGITFGHSGGVFYPKVLPNQYNTLMYHVRSIGFRSVLTSVKMNLAQYFLGGKILWLEAQDLWYPH